MKNKYCTGAPDKLLNINWSSCCKQHDNDYGKNSKVSRGRADLTFKQCLISKGVPYPFAETAYIFLRTFGWMFYKKKKWYKIW